MSITLNGTVPAGSFPRQVQLPRRSEDINANAGSVQHMDALTRLAESTSKEPFEVIQVELKR